MSDRSAGITDLDNAPVAIGGVNLAYQTDWRKIVKLDCLDRPGLTEKEFFGLFAKCDVCGLVMAQQVFPSHYCSPFGEDGLELTDNE